MSLAQKGALLLLIPVIIQLFLLVGLILLDLETEYYPLRASQDTELTDEWTKYVLDEFAVIQGVKRSIAHANQLEPACEQHLQDLKRDTEHSARSYQEFDERRRKLVIFDTEPQASKDLRAQTSKMLEMCTINAEQLVNAAKQASLSNNRVQSYRQITQFLPRPLQELTHLTAFDSKSASAPEKQAEMRNSYRLLLLTCSIINLAVVLAIGVFFIADIFKRLNTILTNVERIQSDQILEARVPGKDEIAKLDESFHELSRIMNQTIYPYKTMLENAQDLICSIDRNGRLLDVSRASVSLLGYTPEELKGTWINDIIEPSNQKLFTEKLVDVANGNSELPFEIRMIGQDNSLVDVLWSLTWSAQDRTIFGVGHDITEMKSAERFQQDVIQMVSHDLKSPLTAISNFHELLESGMYGQLEDKYLEQVGVAKRSADRMLILVNDLLAVERMRSGSMQLERDEVSLSSIFEQAIESVIGLANEHRIHFNVVPTTVTAFIDERRMIQVLINLLSNAIKFAPENSEVTLAARQLKDFVEVSVTDQGRGIPQHLLGSIFDRFSQVQASDATKKGGSGLGLAICKALVEQHGGSISVISESGKGCTFSFRIPKQQQQQQQQSF